MKKKLHFAFLLTMLLSMWALSGMAAAPDDGVWVERLDGTKQGFVFADFPKVTYTADQLVMTTKTVTATFPFAELRRVYFADDVVTAIREVVVADGSSPVIRATAEGAQLAGFAPKTAVEVYSASGLLLSRDQTAADGTLTVSLTARPQGIYIIKTNQTTLKILKK